MPAKGVIMADTATTILATNGFQNPDAIVRAANDTGLPLGVAVAMIAKESMGRNIYGSDAGGVLAGAGEVTQDNFTNQFLPAVLGGATSNGVGLTQITYPGYFRQNPGYAFWDPYSNAVFGFKILLGYLAATTPTPTWWPQAAPTTPALRPAHPATGRHSPTLPSTTPACCPAPTPASPSPPRRP